VHESGVTGKLHGAGEACRIGDGASLNVARGEDAGEGVVGEDVVDPNGGAPESRYCTSPMAFSPVTPYSAEEA
jgi:hypothetical protein